MDKFLNNSIFQFPVYWKGTIRYDDEKETTRDVTLNVCSFCRINLSFTANT